MNTNCKLYNKFKKYSLEDIIELENNDRQFLALKFLYKNKNCADEMYLFLTIANALICYQLSGKGEDYWEEFSQNAKEWKIENFDDAKKFLVKFLPASKNNKRLVNIKLKRVERLKKFYCNMFCDDFYNKQIVKSSGPVTTNKWKYYYKNMYVLAQDLAEVMGQKITDKTIVFAVKMFGYAGRNVFRYIEYYPENLTIPIDSRLERIYLTYSTQETYTKKDIMQFYVKLSKKITIPPLHLDVLLWIK